MKYIIITITILALATSGWYVFTTPSNTQSICEYDLYDITDSIENDNSTNGIIEKLGLHTHPRNGCTYTSGYITDVDYNPIFTVSVPPVQNGWLYSPVQREEEADKFIGTIRKNIEAKQSCTSKYPRSSIYIPVMTFANALANENADKKILILHTNAYEHSSHFSFYKERDINKLKVSPLDVKNTLRAVLEPDNLSGLVVYILYKPINQADNDLFALSSSLFKELLEDAGAVVHIQANLSSNTLNNTP